MITIGARWRNDVVSVMISAVDYDRVKHHSWCVNDKTASGNPYVKTTIIQEGKRTTLYLHGFITNCPFGFHVDHKDRNTFNNTRDNLRIANRWQNEANKPPRNASGYKGVTLVRNKFRAKILGEHIGYFHSIVDAAMAYDAEAYKVFGEWAYLNFPEHYAIEPYTKVDIPFS